VAFTWAIAQLAVVALFAGSVDWTRPTSGLYVAFVVSVVAIGAAAIYANVRARRQERTFAAEPSAREP
jgi:predicted membrane protein